MIHNAIRPVNYLGEQICTAEVTDQAAADGGAAGIKQVFSHNLSVTVPQCLQYTNLGALFLHHAVHGCHADQRRNQEEKDREHIGNAVHNGGVAFKAYIAGIGIPAQNIGGGFGDILYFLPGIRQFFLRLFDFIVKFLFGCFVFFKALF